MLKQNQQSKGRSSPRIAIRLPSDPAYATSKDEIEFLAGIQQDLKTEGCRVAVNPAYSVTQNLLWLNKFIREAERQIVLMNEAVSKLLESDLYQAQIQEKGDEIFFAKTSS